MNLVEGLARELVRVARLEATYEDIGESGVFALKLMGDAIEEGCQAMGDGDINRMLAALASLQGFEK